MIVGADLMMALSGRKQRSAVAAWCKKQGIKFFRNADGWPVTTAAELDRSMTKTKESGPHSEIFDEDPN